MQFNPGVGMGRDPKYPGKFGIPDFIINTPQRTSHWWLVAAILAVGALPFGLWGVLVRGGLVAQYGYFAAVAAMLLNAWYLRNDINEEGVYLIPSVVSGFVQAGLYVWLAFWFLFPQGQVTAAIIALAQVLIGLNCVYRSWQALLIIGLFTVQKRGLPPPPWLKEYHEKMQATRPK